MSLGFSMAPPREGDVQVATFDKGVTEQPVRTLGSQYGVTSSSWVKTYQTDTEHHHLKLAKVHSLQCYIRKIR